MQNSYKIVTYRKNRYAVIDIVKKGRKYPLVLDYADFKIVKDMNKKWSCGSYNHIFCRHTKDDKSREIPIHDVVKILEDRSNKDIDLPIVHINRVNFDNRRENLIYDEKDKDHNKNMKKKKRTISLPEDSGIDVNEMPTYVWYMKANDTHGERFMVSIGDIKWKTSSSKDLSLKQKFEEAKKFLRDMKKTKPEIFDNYCMNGEYTKKGKELLKSFKIIVEKAGYKVSDMNIDNITDSYLKPKKIKVHQKNTLAEKL